ncbi:hypothetical protein CCHL11_06188, partial [Colletotrichum chlorophyti]
SRAVQAPSGAVAPAFYCVDTPSLAESLRLSTVAHQIDTMPYAGSSLSSLERNITSIKHEAGVKQEKIRILDLTVPNIAATEATAVCQPNICGVFPCHPDGGTQENVSPDALGKRMHETSLEVLEMGVQIGMDLLESLKSTLSAATSLCETETSTWVKAINNLQKHAQPTKTVACLFTDLLDPNGNTSYEYASEDSEAGIAFAKIKSVYPGMTRNDIAKSSPELLINEPAVACCAWQYQEPQGNISSRPILDKKNYAVRKDVLMEFWSLIKVVRIYTEANALPTGAVIVDLPGIQHSNAARAAVAQNYMMACTGPWIFAPITQAVDDKSAKSLLGDPFKRQLEYDGIFSAITFICSKTDDISVIESTESLGKESKIPELQAKIEYCQRRVKSSEMIFAAARNEQSSPIDQLDIIDTEMEEWEELAKKHANGQPVYTQSGNRDTKKRKRGRTSSKSRTKPKFSDSNESDPESKLQRLKCNSQSDTESGSDDENRRSLTEDNTQERLCALKSQKGAVRLQRKEVGVELSVTEQEMKVFGQR